MGPEGQVVKQRNWERFGRFGVVDGALSPADAKVLAKLGAAVVASQRSTTK
jgi:hypothetical protein